MEHSPATVTLDVHIGAQAPAWWDETESQVADGERAPLSWAEGRNRPAITRELIDWDTLGLTPRWLGEDSSEAVAAIEPGIFTGRGAQEWERFLEGARGRGELALAVSTIGSPGDGGSQLPWARGAASVLLPGALFSNVGGERLSLASRPEPAQDLGRADRDLALRLTNTRPTDLPWWRLTLSGAALEGAAIGTQVVSAQGTLSPLLLSRVGEVVAAIWTSDDGAIRHYLLPYLPTYAPVLDWLTRQGLPEFNPAAVRRTRTSLATEPELQTTAETTARARLTELEADYQQQRSEVEAELTAAVSAADEVRQALLYGKDTPLQDAVSHVLSDAGIAARSVDELLSGTRNADLLATWEGNSVLVEVKGTSGNASESLAEPAVRHLNTWPQLRPDLPVSGVVLIINHQARIHPLDRTPAPYNRREFTASLTFPVLSTAQLYDWWRRGEHAAIQSAIFGHAAKSTAPALRPDAQQRLDDAGRSAPTPRESLLRRLFARRGADR
jgi:hypothetical protein